MQKRGGSSIPEGVEVDPLGGAGVGVGGHEDGGGEGEAEGGEAEGEDQGVEATELLDGNGGVEVGVGGSGRSSAVAEGVRGGRHGWRLMREREWKKGGDFLGILIKRFG